MALEQPLPYLGPEPDIAPREPRVHVRVAERARARQPDPLALARSDDPLADGGRPFAPRTGRAHELEGGRRVELAYEIDPVEQRPAQPSPVARAIGRITAALLPAGGARAGVAGSHE